MYPSLRSLLLASKIQLHTGDGLGIPDPCVTFPLDCFAGEQLYTGHATVNTSVKRRSLVPRPRARTRLQTHDVDQPVLDGRV